jgi:hypothetical protein
MRMIMLSALFAIGVGLAGSTGATAAPAVDNFSKAANSTSIMQDAYCRVHRTCWWRHGRRFCDVRRRCW